MVERKTKQQLVIVCPVKLSLESDKQQLRELIVSRSSPHEKLKEVLWGEGK